MASSSLEGNKLVAAILMAGIIGSGSGVFSRILYQPKELKEDAYKIEVPKEAAGGGGEAKAEPEKPIGVMLASANVQQGQEIVEEVPGLPQPRQGRPEQGRARTCGASSAGRWRATRASATRPR